MLKDADLEGSVDWNAIEKSTSEVIKSRGESPHKFCSVLAL
jgi:hypothetical protein